MAGTITKTSDTLIKWGYEKQRIARKIVVDWVGDAADGSVPKLTISNMHGYVIKAVTNPGGSVAPTDNYDIALEGSADTTIDHLAAALQNRDTANTEAAYPAASGAATPVWLDPDDYKLSISGNIVNSATGQIILYLVDCF
jgi:hypothetical protein